MSRKLSIGTAWTESATFLRREHRLIAPLVLGLIVFPAVIAGLVRPDAPPGVQPQAGGWTVVAFAALLIAMVGQLAIMRLAMGWEGSVGGALNLAVRRIWAVLGAFMIFGLVFVLVATIAVLIVMIVGGRGIDGATNRIAFAAMLVALLVMPRVLPLTALSMEERVGPWRLLRRTLDLTRDNYWRLLGFFLIFLIGSFILAAAVTTTVGTVTQLLIGPPHPMTVSRLIVALVTGLAQGLVLSVYAAMTGKLTLQLLGGSIKGT
ncbi:MAG TPA: hypothetical protein VNI79_05845 [Sphingomicrobium sp.]|nr:hypothetical protein [Sphingomicrobium sp.]